MNSIQHSKTYSTMYLQDITRVRLSTFNDFAYYIFDPISQCLHMTNDFNNPYYICTSYEINYFKYLQIKKLAGLIEIDSHDINNGFDFSRFSLQTLLDY